MRIQWNLDGFRELRRDPALVAQIDELADDVAGRAGRGFDWKSRTDTERHRAIVFTDTPRSKVVNARDNTLLKVIGGGG